MRIIIKKNDIYLWLGFKQQGIDDNNVCKICFSWKFHRHRQSILKGPTFSFIKSEGSGIPFIPKIACIQNSTATLSRSYFEIML